MYNNMWLVTKSTEDLMDYKEKRKKTQRAISKVKNEAWQKIGNDIEECIGNTQASKAEKVLKTLRTQNKDSAGISGISIDEWRKHYQSSQLLTALQLLTENRAEFAQITREENEGNSENIPPVTAKEVYTAAKLMKNGKAPGPGKIHIEPVKAAPTISYYMKFWPKYMINVRQEMRCQTNGNWLLLSPFTRATEKINLLS